MLNKKQTQSNKQQSQQDGSSKMILELWIIENVSGANEDENWWIIGRQQISENRNGTSETGLGQSSDIVIKPFYWY